MEYLIHGYRGILLYHTTLSFQGFMSNEQSTNVCLLFVLYFTVPSNLLNSVSDNKKVTVALLQ